MYRKEKDVPPPARRKNIHFIFGKIGLFPAGPGPILNNKEPCAEQHTGGNERSPIKMKDVTLFYLEACPYSLQARRFMREICDENPDYNCVNVSMVEEHEQRDEAAKHDYYYVPCFYVDGKKMSEGAIDKAGVREVFECAMRDDTAKEAQKNPGTPRSKF